MSKQEVVLHPEISKWRDYEEAPDLRKNMEERGQLGNLIFRKLPDGKLELLAGNRRYRELQALGVPFEKIKKTVMDNVSDKQALLIAMSENRFRQDLSSVEEGRMFLSMTKINMFVEEIALRYKCSQTYVKTRIALLDLPTKVLEFFERGDIEMSYAKPVNRLKILGEKAQLILVKDVIEGKGSYSYGHVKTVEEAEEFVEKVFAAQKYTEKLVAKYGPCPACGSKDIGEPSFGDEDKLICRKCEHEWHKKTKDPWKLYELRKDAEELGLKLEIGEGKAKLSPEDITEIMKRTKAELDNVTKLPKTMRTTRTVSELLAPFIKAEKLLSFRIEGETIHIRLIEDSKLIFTARKHNYQTGENTRVTIGSLWDEKDKGMHRRRVKKYVETLQKT